MIDQGIYLSLLSYIQQVDPDYDTIQMHTNTCTYIHLTIIIIIYYFLFIKDMGTLVAIFNRNWR